MVVNDVNELKSDDRWRLVYSKPRAEVTAKQNLERQGFKTYLPFCNTTKRQRGVKRAVVEPMFPRYLFVSYDSQELSSSLIGYSRGVVGLVRFGGEIAAVPVGLVEALQSSELKTDHHDLMIPFKAGDKVKVVSGPFKGLEALFQASSGAERAIILLNMMGQKTPVVMDIEALDQVG